MHLLILGATGRTGTELVQLGAARGHSLTAIVRSPHKLVDRPAGLRVVTGDPLDASQLTAALAGCDAVLSALGPPIGGAFRPSTLMTRAASSTVAAMTRAGVSRLAVVSAAVLFPLPGLYFRFFRWLLRQHARDLSGMEHALCSSALDWTIARPPRLVVSPDAAYRSQEGALPTPSHAMSYRAVAAFMLDCVERRTHRQQIVGLGRVVS